MNQAGTRWTSLPGMMLGLAREMPDRPMLTAWRGGRWETLPWGGFAMKVAAVAAWLRAQGVMPGDRVLLVSENRPEFLIADVAIMTIGAVTVPTYVTNTVADHAHVLGDSGARVAVVSTAALARAVVEAAGRTGGLDLLVCMEAGAPEPPGGRLAEWAALEAAPSDVVMLMAEAEHIPAGRLACLIYTSGTGGTPRGVMLPHRALLANREGIRPLIARLHVEGEKYLSFLPMSHSYEHTVGGYLLPSFGMEVVYSRGADRLGAEMAEFKPAIITAVPRLFEVLRARITAQVEKDGGLKKRLFDQALALGLRKMDGPPLNLLERVQDAVLDRLVRNKIRARFGGNVRALVSGSARLDPELSGFFLALGLPLIQGYGQSEAGPVISVNLPWANARHSVGPPLPGVEVRIAEDGEILVAGGLVMDGYWNNPEATEAALRPSEGEGKTWLHTGDVGRMEEGRLVITDRKRDFIKLKGGDMVAPSKLEALLVGEPEIAQAVAAGEGMAGVVALLVPAEGQAESLAGAVARVNAKLSPVERIRRWTPVTEPFTVENGMLTPTMKVKRRLVLERYAGVVNGLG
ncbi:MAG TPA: AMP-binding protein [Roseococcus sp.]|jgi:long-chain acyl-CoA synthetase|nr:AMP-binding protein [Roseococcus sp.]